MELTREEFNKLAALAKSGSLNAEELAKLEPYRVKRAVFIAAGFGLRMAPITLNTPKPLVRVKGVRIIDRLIDACLAADIQEIYIVRGYLGEQFDQLLAKYPMLKFIDNDLYRRLIIFLQRWQLRIYWLMPMCLRRTWCFTSQRLLRNTITSQIFWPSKRLLLMTGALRLRITSLLKKRLAVRTAGRWWAYPIGMKQMAKSWPRIYQLFLRSLRAIRATGSRCHWYIASSITR